MTNNCHCQFYIDFGTRNSGVIIDQKIVNLSEMIVSDAAAHKVLS
jgi:hypothetical protein